MGEWFNPIILIWMLPKRPSRLVHWVEVTIDKTEGFRHNSGRFRFCARKSECEDIISIIEGNRVATLYNKCSDNEGSVIDLKDIVKMIFTGKVHLHAGVVQKRQVLVDKGSNWDSSFFSN